MNIETTTSRRPERRPDTQSRMRTRWAPVIMLALLSPVTAEFLLGDQYLGGMAPAGRQLIMLIGFLMFYGMAALLVRELARRLHLGWPGLLLLGLAFGIFEEGLITQSLFNPHYLGLDLTAPGHIEVLGIGAPWTVFVISLHVVWSMSAPVAITEAWAGRNASAGDHDPWLGRMMLPVVVTIFVLGAALTFAFSYLFPDHPFMAASGQLIGAAVVIIAVVAAALVFPRRNGRTAAGRPMTGPDAGAAAGSPVRQLWLPMLFGVAATSALQLSRALSGHDAWLGTGAMLLVWLVGLSIMVRTRPAPFGTAAGAILTYGWVGMRSAIPAGPAGIVEQSVLVLLVLVLLGWTISRRSDRPGSPTRPGRSPARP